MDNTLSVSFCFTAVLCTWLWSGLNYSLLSATTFRNQQQTDWLQDSFDSWAVFVIQLVLQQCCKTSCTFLLPVIPITNLELVTMTSVNHEPATNWLTARQLWFVGGICYSTCFAAMLQNKLHIFVARYTNYQSRASYHDICEPWLLLTRLQTNQSWNIEIFKMLNSFL